MPPILRRLLASFVVLMVASLYAPVALLAHQLLSGVGTQSFFRFSEEKVSIRLNFEVARDLAVMVMEQDIDTNADEYIDRDEANAWVKLQGVRLLKDLRLHVNGQRIELKIVEASGRGVAGKLQSVPIDCYYELEGALPPRLPGGGWWFHYHDRTYSRPARRGNRGASTVIAGHRPSSEHVWGW